MLVSVTRLHLRGWRFLPAFCIYTYRSMRQVQSSAGYLGGQVADEPSLAYWTITLWADEQAMRGFRNNAAHLKAMPHLLDWCDEASYTHWQQEETSAPTLDTAFKRLRESGKVSKVRHPNANQEGRKTVGNAPPRPKLPLPPRHS